MSGGWKDLLMNPSERALSTDINRLQTFKGADLGDLWRALANTDTSGGFGDDVTPGNSTRIRGRDVARLGRDRRGAVPGVPALEPQRADPAGVLLHVRPRFGPVQRARLEPGRVPVQVRERPGDPRIRDPDDDREFVGFDPHRRDRVRAHRRRLRGGRVLGPRDGQPRRLQPDHGRVLGRHRQQGDRRATAVPGSARERRAAVFPGRSRGGSPWRWRWSRRAPPSAPT